MTGQAAASSDHDLATVTPLWRRSGGGSAGVEGTAAEYWEAVYRQQGRTLRDGSTADAHRTALATVALLLDGAEAEGEVPPAAAAYLKGLLIEGIQVPDQL
ncbi:hypothetical protein [Kitasatospora sp. NPDC058478]|uniref:hypothetical protein n=1 Tax=unclassified Kitasatospora TaxID=2633591 RepID=UPI00365E7F79